MGPLQRRAAELQQLPRDVCGAAVPLSRLQVPFRVPALLDEALHRVEPRTRVWLLRILLPRAGW